MNVVEWMHTMICTVTQKNVVMKSYIGNVHANFLIRVNIMMTIFNLIKQFANGIIALLYLLRKVLIFGAVLTLLTVIIGFINTWIMQIMWMFILCALPVVPTFAYLRNLIINITIYKHGECFKGTCIGYDGYGKGKMLKVLWNDNKGREHIQNFDALNITSKFPFQINVYCKGGNDNYVNLGINTIFANLFMLFLFLFVSIITMSFFVYVLSDTLPIIAATNN